MPDKFRVVEVFKSIQGEGKHMGTPSIFIRLFGCNLQCEGFGMPEGEKSMERHDIAENMNTFDTLDTLPLVHTGCDSYASWDARFKHLATEMSPVELVDKVDKLVGRELMPEDFHVVITGGEPLLKTWSGLYLDFFEMLVKDLGIYSITFETNGTQKWPAGLDQFAYTTGIDFTLSISPKMKASGEPRSKAWKEDAIKSLFYSGATDVFFKFVVQNKEHVDEIDEFFDATLTEEPHPAHQMVYLMPVGGCLEEYRQNAPEVARLALKRGYSYSPRLHIDVFGNSWGT